MFTDAYLATLRKWLDDGFREPQQQCMSAETSTCQGADLFDVTVFAEKFCAQQGIQCPAHPGPLAQGMAAGAAGGMMSGGKDGGASGYSGARGTGKGASPLGKCSFSGDTEVLMADGTTKPIDEVQAGDEVIATDPETGEQGPREVTHTWPHQDDLVQLSLSTGMLTTTEDHPFWNDTDQAWQRADALDPGDHLRTPDGVDVTVAELITSGARHGRAYNLTVDDLHTYYVLAGDTPVLVHNSGSCVPALRGWQSERFQFGNQQFLLDKKGMDHILTRHHRDYWDGSVRNTQTFFSRGMSVDDVQGAIRGVMQQNRGALIQKGTTGRYQVRGNVGGTDYVLGVNNGRVAQFYPVK